MNLQNILSQQRRLHLSLSTVNETLLLCRKLVRNQIASHQFNGLSINPFKAVNWSSFVSRRFSHQEGKGQLMLLLPRRNFWNKVMVLPKELWPDSGYPQGETQKFRSAQQVCSKHSILYMIQFAQLIGIVKRLTAFSSQHKLLFLISLNPQKLKTRNKNGNLLKKINQVASLKENRKNKRFQLFKKLDRVQNHLQ